MGGFWKQGCLWVGMVGALAMVGRGQGQEASLETGRSVIGAEALLKTPVGGLERTQATAKAVEVKGEAFPSALQVRIGMEAAETNATQLTLPITMAVKKGDALLASFSLRGASVDGKSPAEVMLLFERSTSPWTKSVSQGVVAARKPEVWKRTLIPFTAVEDYAPGEAMVSLRFAFGPQMVEVGGLTVVDYGKTKSPDALRTLAAERNPLGTAKVAVHLMETRQTLVGFGGDFCQPRYGATEMLDAVGRYTLEHLPVAHARIGIPLDRWTPMPGVYQDTAQAHAALLQMQEMAHRKIPIVGSVWEGPGWMLGGRSEQMGRRLPKERYADCSEAIAQFLVTARDKYGVKVENVSFNEPDYGVNFLFTSEEMAAFIRQAGPRFRALGLKTTFLVGDTTGGMPFVKYARPLLEDRELAPSLGPLAFHCWDALGAPDTRYAEIAALGREFHKPVWCTEAGHDAQLWQSPDPWRSWENALRTALAYEKTLRLTGAVVMDYWTYQDNYPIVSKDGGQPYPVYWVLRQMGTALPAGATIATAESDNDDLRVLAATGPQPDRFSVLLIDTVGAGKVTVSGLPPHAAVSLIRSIAAGQEQTTGQVRVDGKGELTLSVAARSVVTLLGLRTPTAHPALLR